MFNWKMIFGVLEFPPFLLQRSSNNMRIKYLLLIPILLMLLNSSFVEAVDKKAEDYFNNAEYLKAAKRWQKIGDRKEDNGVSFYKLAQLYQDGLGVDKDTVQAINWLQRSAKKGYVPAMYALGDVYMWGEEEVKNINFAVYWFEKAVEQNDSAATLALANFFMQPPRKDLLKSRALAAQLLSSDFETAKELFNRIDKQIEDLNIGGSRDIHTLSEDLYTLELMRFNDFASAWHFVVKNEIADALIYRSVYSDFVVVWGNFVSPLDAFQSVRGLSSELKQLKPRVRALTVIKSQILAATEHFAASWLFEQPSEKHTVELFRGASPLQAMDFVDLNGLANSSIYKTKLAEYVVIAGVFDSEELAQSVVSKLPPKMKLFNPLQRRFSAVKIDADFDPNYTLCRIMKCSGKR